MVIGVGTDIIDIDRFDASSENQAFMQKYFTPNEIDYFKMRKNKAHVIAKTYCVKEAVAKALGTGFIGFTPIDIEVLRVENSNRPYVNLYNEAYNLGLDINLKKIHVSVSHSNTSVIAFAVLEGHQ